MKPTRWTAKKIFHITDEGRAYLQEEKDRPELSEAGEQGWEEREQSLPEEDNGHWEGVRRNRRLTPKGKELLHLLKAAERAALSDADKAVELRELLDNLRDSLRRIVADSGRNGGEGGRP